MIKYSKKTWLVLLLMFVAAFSFTFLNQKFKDNNGAQAANVWAFDPGYIISDWQMGNYNSMSEADIQDFLTRMNPCDNRDYGYYQQLTRNEPGTQWHWSGDYFVCLSQERFGNSYTEIGSGETAAHIIWQTAQDYRINPQALIVLLEKESGLISDRIPNNYNYRTAAGFGCPDEAPCASEYFGFRNQLRKAAGLFREVLDGGWSNYPVGVNYVRYNPNAACGGTNVNIRNRATSALYRYTPYQPNYSALAAGYGMGDSCGAYGNRNFYLLFEDWFGGITNDKYPMPESSRIEEGVYTIQSALNSNKVVDIANGAENAKDGTNIQLFDSNKSEAQKWQIKNNGDGTYTVINPKSGKTIDVSGGGMQDGVNVQIYQGNSSCAQKWRIAQNDDGTYTFYSTCSGRPLDVNGASAANGANIQIYAPNKTTAQKWILKLYTVPETSQENVVPKVPSSESGNNAEIGGVYTIRSALNSNKVVDIANGAENAKDGTNIQLFDSNKSEAQKWQIVKNLDGTYTIINPRSQKTLDVAGAGIINGANVQIFLQNGTCAQKWNIKTNSDGTYTFQSTCSALVLDIESANTNNGTNIQLFTSNNTNAQKWKLEAL